LAVFMGVCFLDTFTGCFAGSALQT